MRLSFLLIFILSSFHLSAQYSYAKSEEFEEIQNRPLIVEKLNIDNGLIEKWEKKIKKGKNKDEYIKLIDSYKTFIEDYNVAIERAIENHWTYNNSEVLFKTVAEVNDLRDSGSKEYTVLFYDETDSQRLDGNGRKFSPSLTVPTLKYSRIENTRFKADYCYFINFSHKRSTITYSDFILSFKLMKRHMEYIVANDERKFDFHEYAKAQAKLNCSSLPKDGLLLRDASIHKKSSLEGINQKFTGNEIRTVSDEEIIQYIENDEDKVVGFFFPFSIVTAKAGPASLGRIQYVRSFVNIKTGEIYTAHGAKTGQFFDPYYREKEFKKYSSCK